MSTLLTDKTVLNLSRVGRQPGACASLVGALCRMFVGFLSRRALHKVGVELKTLDDRMLKDIGIDRSEIASLLIDAQERMNGAR